MSLVTALMPEGRQRYYNNDGTPCAGGQLSTFAAGTTAPKATYADAAGTVPNPTTITLDAKGEAVVYWSGAYKVALFQADGTQVTGYPVDNINTDPAGLLDLLTGAGADKIGTGTDTVGSALSSLRLADYAALRAYSGPQKSVYVSGYLATAKPSGVAGAFVLDSTDLVTADDGGLCIVDHLGRRWKRSYAGPVFATWYGAKGDGVADDTLPILAALAIGAAFLPPGTYKTTATLPVDYSKSSLHGDRATITSSVAAGSPAIKVFSSASYGADGKDPYTKNYVQEACKGFALVGTRQTPAPAGGAGFIGWQIGQAGADYFQSGDAQIVDCPTFGFDTQILFADNGWRVKFKECALSGGNYPIWFSNPNNAGEVMVFEGCWIVGWAATLLINGGYFVFDRCSLFGSATGNFVVQNSADVMLRDCNSEVSNTRGNIMFSVETTARLIMDGGSIVFDGDMTAPIFQGDNTYAMVILEKVSLPLYGANLKYEQNAWGDNQIRSLVQRGTNLVVQARGCFPKAGVLNDQTKLQAIIGGGLNLLGNGSAERGNTSGWSNAGGAMSAITDNPRNPRYCFEVVGGAYYQNINVAGQSGRWFSVAFWAKPIAGAGALGNPKLLFVDTGLNPLATYTVATINADGSDWAWYCYNGVVPEGANLAQVTLDSGVTPAATIAFDDVYFGLY